MKFLLLLTLGFISILGINGQTFVSYGTGVAGIPYQSQMLPTMKYGCLVLACCVKGGLGSRNQVINARNWALSQGYIRSDNYVLIDSNTLAQRISQKYGTTYHSDLIIKKCVYGGGSTHFYLVNSNGKEVFNSAGLGWHGK